jgi:DNA repair protein RecN (Recombination protein N)
VILDLHVENFAIIDDLRLRFGPGLNVLTGETGAGKSIVIDAVEVALGGRALTDYVRHGADRAFVEIAFGDLSEATRQGVEAMGLGEPGDELVLSREILASGRSLARVNGRSVTAHMLKALSSLLIDIHGQHEHQSLLDPQRHLGLLDGFGGPGITQSRQALEARFEEASRLRSELASLGMDERERAQRLDILEYQVREIRSARLSPAEEAELLSRQRVLANAERLAELCSGAFALLHEGDGASCQELAGRAAALLGEAARLDPSLEGMTADLGQVQDRIQDMARGLRSYLDRIEYDPGAISQVEERLEVIARLKRKYGGTVEEVLDFKETASRDIERLLGSDERARLLQGRLKDAEDLLSEEALRLSGLRLQAALELERRVKAELLELGMAKVQLAVAFTQLDSPGPGGVDQVEFVLSANPGEPPRPLHRVASGGELSRIMLAMKAALAEADGIPTLIFDEIDSGIGGRAASVLGRKLGALGSRRQVICVTHLAAIASWAERHFSVRKVEGKGRTVARVALLDEGARLEEIARMLGGEVSETTLKHAGEMLRSATAG